MEVLTPAAAAIHMSRVRHQAIWVQQATPITWSICSITVARSGHAARPGARLMSRCEKDEKAFSMFVFGRIVFLGPPRSTWRRTSGLVSSKTRGCNPLSPRKGVGGH